METTREMSEVSKPHEPSKAQRPSVAHIGLMDGLARKAKEFSRNQSFSLEHRKQCEREAKLFAEIVYFLKKYPV